VVCVCCSEGSAPSAEECSGEPSALIARSSVVALCTSCLRNLISSSQDSKQGFDCHTTQLLQRHNADENRKTNHGFYGGFFFVPSPDVRKRPIYFVCHPARNNSAPAGRMFMKVFTDNQQMDLLTVLLLYSTAPTCFDARASSSGIFSVLAELL
jgi:hypothetical protein